jgi:UDP-N-acetyl-D-mannosaminuronic acid dehydrogenase
MPLSLSGGEPRWEVRKIGVIGPGIVGMPMAALLAEARVKEGTEAPAPVTVVQRASATSGWKVDAINAGRSPIGGVEPDLQRIVAAGSAAGLLRASSDYGVLRDADVVLVCVQTDKAGFAPDYGPLFQALDGLAAALREKPQVNVPLVVFESTLAPSSMATLVKDHFARSGLQEGRDVLLGNSPNRVMPGRLVERVAASDKLAGGLHPRTPELIQRLYRRIVTRGTVHPTNSLTAEIVKTLENAYRDVRIAFAAEVVRHCDAHDVDFYAVRDAVNTRLAQTDGASGNPTAVPSGGVLVPMVGVGGHCLPKDGILLWWRALEAGEDTSASLILEARQVNDEAPGEALRLAERTLGTVRGRPVAVLGAAYRFDSEDTRNSPSLTLAELLRDQGCAVTIQDPYVKPDDQNLVRRGLDGMFTNDLGTALAGAEYAFLGTAHRVYVDAPGEIVRHGARLKGLFDGANAYRAADFAGAPFAYGGMGRGRKAPPTDLLDFVHDSFRAMERGLANEVAALVEFLNGRFAADDFNRVRYAEVRRLAATCGTGCALAEPGPPLPAPEYRGFTTRLARRASAGRFTAR